MKTKQLPKGWKEVGLKELGDISTGGTPSRPKQEYWGGNIPWLKISNLKNFYVKKYDETITKKGLENSSAKLFPKDTILISIFASLGDVAILKIESTTNQAIAGIYNLRKDVYNLYLAYYLKSLKKYFEKIGRGVAQNNINLSILKNTKIPLPPILTQKKIVSILEKTESLKEKVSKAEKLLDEYLKSVFYEIFLKEKCKFEKHQGLELFEFSYGKGLPKSKRSEEGYNVYGSNGIIGYHKEYLIKGPGIVIGRKGSIGEINFSENNFWPIDTTYYISQKKKFNWIFLYYLLKSTPLKHLNKSAAIPGLNRNDVYSINFIYPPLPLQQKFAKIVKHIEELKENVNKTKQNSEELFNSLMSKAFKGELTI